MMANTKQKKVAKRSSKQHASKLRQASARSNKSHNNLKTTKKQNKSNIKNQSWLKRQSPLKLTIIVIITAIVALFALSLIFTLNNNSYNTNENLAGQAPSTGVPIYGSTIDGANTWSDLNLQVGQIVVQSSWSGDDFNREDYFVVEEITSDGYKIRSYGNSGDLTAAPVGSTMDQKGSTPLTYNTFAVLENDGQLDEYYRGDAIIQDVSGSSSWFGYGGEAEKFASSDSVGRDPFSSSAVVSPATTSSSSSSSGGGAADGSASPAAATTDGSADGTTKPADDDDRWVKGGLDSDDGDEYFCEDDDKACYWKNKEGVISDPITDPTRITAIKKAIESSPDSPAEDTSGAFDVISVSWDRSDITQSHLDDYVEIVVTDASGEIPDGAKRIPVVGFLDGYVIPQKVHQQASQNGYETIIDVKKEGNDVLITYQSKTGDTRVVQDTWTSDDQDLGYKITETQKVPGVEIKGEDGKPTGKKSPDTTVTKVAYYNTLGEQRMYYSDDQKTKSGEQIVNFQNSKYYDETTFVVDEKDIDPRTGACESRNCYKGINNEKEKTGTVKDVRYDESTIDKGYISELDITENKEGKFTTEEYIYYQNEKKLFNRVSVTRKYESKEGADGDKDEVLYETTNGARRKVFERETLGDSTTEQRVYYDNIGGTFFQKPNAVATDSDCFAGGSCTTVVFTNERDDREGIDGSKKVATAIDDQNGNGVLDEGEQILGQSEVKGGVFGEDKIEDCKALNIGADCSQVEAAADKNDFMERFLGQNSYQQASGQIIGTLASTTYQPLSSLLCGGGVCFPEAVQAMDQWFAGSIINSDYYSSAFCEQIGGYYQKLQAEGVAVSYNGQNTRGIGTANADYSGPQPVLCDLDQAENEGCPENHYCKQDLCYNKDTDEVAMGYLYYITWGVTAPQDEALTTYLDEGGYGITYNIVLKRSSGLNIDSDGSASPANSQTEVRLYSYQGDSSYPLVLYNGDSDGQKLVHMSVDPMPYDEICIEWGAAPRTARAPQSSQLFGNLGPQSDEDRVIPDLCTTIQGEEIDAVELLGGLVDSKTSSTVYNEYQAESVTTDTLQTNSGW